MEHYLKALADSKFGSLWLDQDIRPEPLAPLAGDEKCQLLIVGGGFTGLWGALQAKERMPELDIILIESTFIGNGASGRNGGMLHAALAHGETNADYHFPGEKQRIRQLGRQNLKEFIESLARYNIDARYEKVAPCRSLPTKTRSQIYAKVSTGGKLQGATLSGLIKTRFGKR